MDDGAAAAGQRHRLQQSECCLFRCVSSSHLDPPTSDVSHALSGLVLKDCPEFDLMFENAFDQWVAGSAGEKCTFIQVLHHACQRYSSARKPEFINCQSKLLGGKKTNNANATAAAGAR